MKEEIDELENKHLIDQEEIANLTQSQEDKSKENEKLNQRILDSDKLHKKMIDDLKKSLEDTIQTRVDIALGEAGAQWEIDRAQLESIVKALEAKNKALDTQNKAMAEELRKLRDENIDQSRQIDELIDKNARLADKDREIEALRKKLAQEQARHQEELERYKNEFEDLIRNRIVRFCREKGVYFVGYGEK